MSNNIKKQVEELEKKHRFVSDNLIDAIWTVNVETMKFEYITESIEKISGFTVDEYINSSIEDRLTPESFKKVAALVAEEIPKFEKGIRTVRTVEVELIHKNGTFYWSEIRAKLFKEGGKHLKIIGVTRDINRQKKYEQRQDELIEKLSEVLAEKEKLLKEIKVLRGLLPICSGCRRIRDEHGKWWPLDEYIRKHTEADLTHTICMDCKDVFYGDLKL